MERMHSIHIFNLHPEISPPELQLLRFLSEHDEGVNVTAIAKELDAPMPAVSRMMRRMESQNLIERKILPSDRRSIIVSITPKGLEDFNKYETRLKSFFAELLCNVPSSDFEDMMSRWNAIMDKMEILLEQKVRELRENEET